MGHFHNPPPPPPIVSATGAQPYAPNKLPPKITAVPVNNPPFTHRLRTQLLTDLAAWAWQPDPWTYGTEIGVATGRQPYGQKQLPPSITAVPVNNPPFQHPARTIALNANVVQIWQPDPWVYPEIGTSEGRQPYGPRQLPPSITAVPVNNPPFTNQEGNVNNIATKSVWQPDPWQFNFLGPVTGNQPYGAKQLNPSITAVPVNNPPFTNQEGNVTNIATKSAWQPDPWQYNYVGATYGLQPYGYRSLNPSITAVPVNNPPFNQRKEPLPGLAAWQPPDLSTYPLTTTRLIQPFVVSVTPFNNAWLATVLLAWQPPDPLPTLQGKLNPSITAVPVNNPPFNQRQEPLPGLAAWQVPDPPIQPQRFTPPQVVVTFVPFNRAWLSTVVSSWQLPDPSPTLAGRLPPQITAVPVNNPPFNQRSEIPNVVQQWQPDPWQFNFLGWTTGLQPYGAKQLPPAITAVPVNNPPPRPYPVFVVVDDPPLPQQLPRLVQPFTASVQVAFQPYWLSGVLASWQPPDPQPFVSNTGQQPLAPNKLPPSITAVPVNNPPFGNYQVTVAYLPPDPSQQPQPRFIPSTAVPPFTLAWLSGVLQSWQIVDPQPTLPRLKTPPSIDNPPFGNYQITVNILPPDLAVQTFLPRHITPPSVDNPPFGLLVTVIEPWVVVPDQPTVAKNLNPALTAVQVNNPPFSYTGRLAYLSNVIQSWQPPDPPPVQRGPLAPSITAVPVNNPPFTNFSRTAALGSIMVVWEIPPPPQPQQTPPSYIVTIKPPAVTRTFSYISASYIQ